MNNNTQISFESIAKNIDDLLEKIKDFPDEQREIVSELIKNIDDFNKIALTKLVKLFKSNEQGKKLLVESLKQPEIYAMFLKYGIIKEDKKVKVAKAIEHIKPYIHSHGGDVELVDIKDNTVIVRLKGSCQGCSQVSFTLQETILEAVKAYVPEIENIELDNSTPVEAFFDIKINGNKYIKTFEIDQLEEGKIKRFKNKMIDAIIILWKGKIYSYKNRCAHQGLTFEEEYISPEGTITCPWHGFQYSVESGECLTVNHIQLEPIPTKIEEGFLWLKVT